MQFHSTNLYWQLIVYYLLYLTRNVTVAGSSSGIHIYAVFISKASGEVLKKFSGHADVEVWILPTFENSAWSIMAISFISLLAMSAVLATCFFVRRHRIRREHPRNPEAREFHGMSSQLVKAMPSLIFTKVQEDNCTSSMCAICLEDYNVGEKLRVLPCRHSMFAWPFNMCFFVYYATIIAWLLETATSNRSGMLYFSVFGFGTKRIPSKKNFCTRFVWDPARTRQPKRKIQI